MLALLKVDCRVTCMAYSRGTCLGMQVNQIITRFIFSILFIGRELTTWPGNNCLQLGSLSKLDADESENVTAFLQSFSIIQTHYA